MVGPCARVGERWRVPLMASSAKAKGHTPGPVAWPFRLFTGSAKHSASISMRLHLTLVISFDADLPNDRKSIATKEEGCARIIVGRHMLHFFHCCKKSRVRR